MVELVVSHSLAEIEPQAWNRCFPGELEDWAYYRATEEAGLDGFTLFYLTLRAGDGRVLAAVPGFFTDYRLDTTVQGAWKRLTERVATVLPGLLSVRLACLGSPVGETLHLGFAPESPEAERPALLQFLLEGFQAHAARAGVGLTALKDARAGMVAEVLGAAGWQRLPGLPTAWLPVPDSEQAYLRSLGRSTRKDMRRKLKEAGLIRIEFRTSIEDVRDQVQALYEETLSRSDLPFERLPAGYFSGILARLPGRAGCYLYWREDRLVAFNLVLADETRLIDKFLGLHHDAARKYNLYFLSWFTNVRHCIAQSIPRYQSGQAGYGPKLRLGSRLEPNFLWFHHRRPLLNGMFRLIGRMVRLDNFDETLRRGAVE